MKLTFEQLINDLQRQMNGASNCQCAKCALERRAREQDSKTETDRLLLMAAILDTIKDNARGMASSVRNGGDEEVKKVASEINSMGYTACAALVSGYLRCMREIQDLYIAAHKEAGEKEDAADQKSAEESAAAAGAER